MFHLHVGSITPAADLARLDSEFKFSYLMLPSVCQTGLWLSELVRTFDALGRHAWEAPIIVCVNQDMWNQKKDSALFEATIKIPVGACYVTLFGPYGEGLRATFRIDDNFDVPLPITPVGETIWGAISLSPKLPAWLRLEAGGRLGDLRLGAYGQAYPTQRWRRVLPACLQTPPAATRELIRGAGKEAAGGGADTLLSADLAEIASNCLSRPLNDEDAQRTLALLRRVAARPLDRSPGLGALVGALSR